MLKESLPRRSGQWSDKAVCIAMAPGSAGGWGLSSLPQHSLEFSGRVVRTEPQRQLEVESPGCTLHFTLILDERQPRRMQVLSLDSIEDLAMD